MKTIYLVLADNGDGSSSIEFHKTMSDEKIALLENDKYDRYASGDGVQITNLLFPDDFDLDAFKKLNNMVWWEEDQEDLCVD